MKKTTPATTTKKATIPKDDPESAFQTISHIGEIVPATGSPIHVREVEIKPRSEKEKARRIFDVRQLVTSTKFNGWGKGIAIPADQVEELRDFCDEYLALVAKRKELKAAKKTKK